MVEVEVGAEPGWVARTTENWRAIGSLGLDWDRDIDLCVLQSEWGLLWRWFRDGADAPGGTIGRKHGHNSGRELSTRARERHAGIAAGQPDGRMGDHHRAIARAVESVSAGNAAIWRGGSVVCFGWQWSLARHIWSGR